MNPHPPLRLAPRQTDAHKGLFGRVLLVGGSRGMSGSIAMSTLASLRAGAGLATAVVPDRCLETVAAFHPALMTRPLADDGHGRFAIGAAAELGGMVGGVTAIGCGPGMSVEPGALRIVERLLRVVTIPRVLDADALNAMAQIGWREELGEQGDPDKKDPWGPLVLTPHPGELKRLTGASTHDRGSQISAAQALAERSGAVIVVKGGPTVVVSRGEGVWTNDTGNPGMATAGSGDVLTGVITGFLAQRLSPWNAARLGVWVHGMAGDLAAVRHGQVGLIAMDILDAIPEAVARAVKA